MSKPLVSVIIPTFQRASTLNRAIYSALAQTYASLEVIVSDNGSTDGTEKILSRAAEHPRVRVVRQAQNIGPVPNWRAAVQTADGDLIKVNWSDDWMEAHVVEHLVQSLRRTDADFIVGGTTIHLPTRKVIRNRRPGTIRLEDVIGSTLLGSGLPVSPGAALIKRLDAEWALDVGTHQLSSCCRDRAIGPDLLMLYGALSRGGTGAHTGRLGVHFEGGDDSITRSTGDGMLAGCYFEALCVLVNSAKDPRCQAALIQLAMLKRVTRRLRRRPIPISTSAAPIGVRWQMLALAISARQLARRTGRAVAR